MVFSSLKHRIVFVFVGLLAAVMTMVMLLVVTSGERIVNDELQRELGLGANVFQRLLQHNQRQLDTAATVLSADFAFREAIATQDRETVGSVIHNHGRRIGARVMMAVGRDGRLIASTQRRTGPDEAFPFPDLLAQAEAGGRSAGFKQMKNGRLYHVVMVPVLAPTRIAWVAMGFEVDDGWTQELAGTTGLVVSVAHRGEGAPVLLATSLTPPQRSALAAALPGLLSHPAKAVEISGQAYQSLLLPIEPRTSVVLQRAVQQVEEPFQALLRTLLLLTAGGVAVFILGSVLFARRIVRPLNHLAAAARRIEAGDYDLAVPRLPADEIGQLGLSFDRMRAGIAQREERIERLAYVDPLTDLPNRTRLLQEIEGMMQSRQGAVAVLNLDRFALINTALGHGVGDRLLREIAARLPRASGEHALTARLWADQFAFVLPDASRAHATGFAHELVAALADPVMLDGQQLDISCSVGVALYPEDGADADSLLRRAELAVLSAKRRRVPVGFTSDQGAEPQPEQLSLIGEMRRAMSEQEFEMHYQPKLELHSGRIVAAEALLRWRHPQRGMVPPGRFIPFAEQTGFIREITPWMLDRVLAEAAQWQSAGLDLIASANLSAADLLNPSLAAEVERLLGKHGVKPHRLCLEITESALMDDPVAARGQLAALSALGVALSIDDYGVGQASLAYLKTLPVDELKIDRSFIAGVAASGRDAAIVDSTIMLCHALSLKVVAEGVEDSADLRWLMEHGCDVAQGYGIARPMPAQDLPAWLARSAAVSAPPESAGGAILR
ncbi:diguanylate cyclase/phosphodiesterase [Noviherbaspirillum humi]|uniref:Diguanylate cyclase/phosphodiesterase n=1 Tax=Noviherbaspirillum humi TaxID=1688639 RepID=A0A239HSD7_9BURK|nr:EAL domain-containing protein [Noviherbaspirillum humi]SNS83783.1 diguanylate cyclase/phosphodiesterase [Noviherbaspirillum humi]